MTFIINTLKWFNETRNGSDFLSNTSDFTVNLKANAGEKVKVFLEFIIENIYMFNPSDNGVDVWINEDGSGQFIQLSGVTWNQLGYRVGDSLEVYDNQTNKIKADVVIDSMQESRIRVTDVGTWKKGTFTDGEIRQKTDFKKFQYEWKTEADITGTRSGFNIFDSLQRYYNTVDVGAGSPVRSTAFVNFIAREPNNWDTGSFKMRYVDNPDTFTQRFEIEHEFIVLPYHLEGFIYDPLTRPNEYKNGTLAFLFDLFNLEDAFIDRRTIGNFNAVGSVGWFNENFDGGVNGYALTSVAYYDVTNAKDINQIDTETTTRVTTVITGALFTASDPVTLYHSKTPLEADYQNEDGDFADIWVEESLRNTIGAVSNSNTIITNLSINLDSSTQITVQYDLVYAGTEDIANGDGYLLYIALEDSNLTSEGSNRVNLFIDNSTYLKSLDEDDLFYLDKYEIYTHPKDYGVDAPTTDFEGYIEDGVLVELEFRLKNDLTSPRIGNDNADIEQMYFQLNAYNTNDDTTFKLTPEAEFVFPNDVLKSGSWEYITGITNRTWKNIPFLLDSADQFNKAHSNSPTLSTDIRYISNDGTYGLYRATIGIKINWQERLQLNQNISGARVNNNDLDDYHEDYLLVDKFKFVDVKNQGLWYSATESHNGFNKILSKYSVGDWIIRPLLVCTKKNLNSNADTTFLNFMPEWKPYFYDTNSDYTAVSETFDKNAVDLGGGLIGGEENKIVVTFDDGEVKTDVANFDGIIRIQIATETGFEIHELSTLRDTYAGNILLGYGTGGVLAEKSIVADKYVITCLVDGALLVNPEYKITGRIFDLELPYDPTKDAGLLAWYDATGLINNTDNAFGTVSALGEVSNFKNLKTDSNYDLVNATVSEQPIFDAVNLKLDFDGINHFLLWTDNNLGSQWTIFVVVEMTSLPTANMMNVRAENFGLENYDKNNIFMFQGEDGANDPRIQVNAYDDAEALEQVYETVSSVAVGSKAVFQFSMYYNNDYYIKIDNVRYDTPDDIMGAYVIPATNSLFFGGDGRVDIGTPNIQNRYPGHFHEMLILPNQDASGKEDDIHDYLKAKWGI